MPSACAQVIGEVMRQPPPGGLGGWQGCVQGASVAPRAMVGERMDESPRAIPTKSASKAGGPGGAAEIPATGYALLGVLTVFWGINFPIMKLALGGFDPWTFRVVCLGAGAAGLFVMAAARGERLNVPRRDRRMLLVTSALSITGWHLFTAFGIGMMPAGRAAILAYTMPLWATLMARFYLDERLTALRVLGLVLGMAGMAVLIGDEFAKLRAAPWGALCIIGAAVAWAAGTVAYKSHRWTMGTAAVTGWQMALGGLPILAGAALFARLPDPGAVTGVQWAALAYAATIPMVLCHWAWNRLVGLAPAGVAVIGTLMIPVVGVISSAPLAGEPVGARELGSLGLVVAALVIVLALPAWRKRQESASK
jgi:drug/metabolite transporter (DMT)-like permease